MPMPDRTIPSEEADTLDHFQRVHEWAGDGGCSMAGTMYFAVEALVDATAATTAK